MREQGGEGGGRSNSKRKYLHMYVPNQHAWNEAWTTYRMSFYDSEA